MKDILKLPKNASDTPAKESPEAKHYRLQRDSLTIRLFETMITSGQVDIREPRRAALCAKHCAETLLDILQTED